jgi:S2P endopeptidase
MIIKTHVSPRCSVSIHSIGVSLILVLPAAFVALDESSVNSRRNVERLRIVAAGAFHNIACYIILLGCVWLGLGSVALTFLGYNDTSQLGLAVLSVERVRKNFSCSLII